MCRAAYQESEGRSCHACTVTLSLGRIRRGLLATEEGKGGHFSEAFNMGFQGGVKVAQRGLDVGAFRCDGASAQFLNFGLRGHRRR